MLAIPHKVIKLNDRREKNFRNLNYLNLSTKNIDNQ